MGFSAVHHASTMKHGNLLLQLTMNTPPPPFKMIFASATGTLVESQYCDYRLVCDLLDQLGSLLSYFWVVYIEI